MAEDPAKVEDAACAVFREGNVESARSPIPRACFNVLAYRALNDDVTDLDDDAAYRHYVAIGHADELAGKRPRLLPIRRVGIGTHPPADETLIDRIVGLEIENAALLRSWDAHLHKVGTVDFSAISEVADDALATPLDRLDCDASLLDEDQKSWRRDGYVIKRSFLPDELIDDYIRIRKRVARPHGWVCWAPYMHVEELRALSLYPPMMDLLRRLVGEEVGLHLNLTGWVSTDRGFHQDDYLNPPTTNSWYAAVWMALDDIHPDSGPFEYIPGSHRWPVLRSHLVRMYLSRDERDSSVWPMHTERLLTSIVQAEKERRGAHIERFIAKKGDILVWHGRLMHRGSLPNVRDMPRVALISHYTGLTHRQADVARDGNGQPYFVHDVPLDFDPYQMSVEPLSVAAE